MTDANFEDLPLKDNSWNIHENNIHILLIDIYKSINSLSKQLLKLPETSTSRYGTKTLF